PFLVAEHVGRNSGFMSAVSASRTGTIAYAGTISQNGRLDWISRAGVALGPAGTPEGDYTDFRLSPDEKTLAASLVDPRAGALQIWLTDLAGRRTLVASGGPITASALWSPDGAMLAFRSNRTGVIEFYQKSAAGGGTDRALLTQDGFRAARIPSNLIVP